MLANNTKKVVTQRTYTIIIIYGIIEKSTAMRRAHLGTTLIARFVRRTWAPSGADRTQMGQMLASWTLLSGNIFTAEKASPATFLLVLQWHIFGVAPLDQEKMVVNELHRVTYAYLFLYPYGEMNFYIWTLPIWQHYFYVPLGAVVSRISLDTLCAKWIYCDVNDTNGTFLATQHEIIHHK